MKNVNLVRQLFTLLVVAPAMSACAAGSSGNDVASPDSPRQGVTLEHVLQKNLEAVRTEPYRGTLDNMDLVLRIDEAAYSLVARYRASTDGFMRIDVFDGNNRVYSEGKDRQGVWEWPGGAAGPENVSHDGVAAVEHGIEFNLFTLAELRDRGHQVELVGYESILENDYVVLKITMSDGFETFRFVNIETGLVELSRDFRAFHPGIDSTRKNIETRYDEWVAADGIVSARRTQNVDLDAGEVLSTTRVLDATYNQPRGELDLPRSYVPIAAPQ